MPIEFVLQEKLSQKFGDIINLRLQSIGGGSINNTYRISFGNEILFCKINSATKFPHLFSKEKRGLEKLAAQRLIKTPAVVDCFEHVDKQFLLLEWIQQGERTERFWKLLGEQLAALHQVSNETFGLNEDNYMGSVPQQNTQHKIWSEFFFAERLAPLLKKCEEEKQLYKNHLRQFEELQKKLSDLFNEEAPSLLHGDLWSGNFMCDASSAPVLIDPAVYYGHRSMDLAMTTLFGGFRQPFYEAYHYHFPLPSNYEDQWAVCNLYPLLIHLYLFGSNYLSQIEHALGRFA